MQIHAVFVFDTPRRQIPFQVPTWRFISARGALQREAPFGEMAQRVMTVKSTPELSHLVSHHPHEPSFHLNRHLTPSSLDQLWGQTQRQPRGAISH